MVPLGTVAVIFNGKTPSKAEQRAFGHPVLKIKDVSESGRFKRAFSGFVDERVARKYEPKWITPGDTLILNAAHNAEYVASKSYFATNEVAGALPTGEWAVIRPDPRKLLPQYCHFWLRSDHARQAVKFLVRGIHLYPKDVATLSIRVPGLAEQHRVVDLLSRAENIVRMRREAEAKAKEIIPALFLDMFGDPARNERGWEVQPFSDVGTVSYGIATKLDTRVTAENGHRIVTISNVTLDGELDLSIERYSQPTDHQAASAQVVAGDLLFNWRNGSETHVGKTAIWEQPGAALHVSFLLRIRPDTSKATSLYVWALLNRLRASGYFVSASRQQVNRKFNASELSAMQILVPPIAMQETFAAVASDLRVHGRTQCRAIVAADQAFQSLLAGMFKE